MDIQDEVRSMTPELTKAIQRAASQATNEAELRTKITGLIEAFALLNCLKTLIMRPRTMTSSLFKLPSMR